MAGELKFFSEEWVEEALKAERAAGDNINAGFKDPDNFNHVLALECSDRPELVSHIEYVGGHSASWSTKPFDESRVWTRFVATVETWRAAAEGKSPGSNLIMGGKIKLTKGPMKGAVENANAFNRFVRSWGEVPTDWDV